VDRIRVTHIGGPTTLIEIGPWRLLTDPGFGAPGRRYGRALGSDGDQLWIARFGETRPMTR